MKVTPTQAETRYRYESLVPGLVIHFPVDLWSGSQHMVGLDYTVDTGKLLPAATSHAQIEHIINTSLYGPRIRVREDLPNTWPTTRYVVTTDGYGYGVPVSIPISETRGGMRTQGFNVRIGALIPSLTPRDQVDRLLDKGLIRALDPDEPDPAPTPQRVRKRKLHLWDPDEYDEMYTLYDELTGRTTVVIGPMS